MSIGTVHPAQQLAYADPATGVRVRQLTGACCHANHVYFTHAGWHADDSRLLIASDRSGSGELYSLDLASGDMLQLTAFADGQSRSFFYAMPSPVSEEVFILEDDRILRIDLASLRQEVLYRIPTGYQSTSYNISADGRRLYFAECEDLSDRIDTDLLNGYVGFAETWAAKPHCRIIALDLASGSTELLWEEQAWIGHVNASPTDPDLLTFCHEGPWNKVDHRIWLLRAGADEPQQLATHRADGGIGHEYWFADGQHVGYHGWRDDLPDLIGRVAIADGQATETLSPIATQSTRPTRHIFSHDHRLVVSDAHDDLLTLWRWTGEDYEARPLATHRGSFHSQRLHVHARFTPDGSQVLYTSDRSGYGQVYLADCPAFDDLPPMPA